MRSGTRRSAGRLSRADDQWPAAAAQVSISGEMQNFLTRAVFSEMQNFPARRWHVLAQLAGWYRRGEWVDLTTIDRDDIHAPGPIEPARPVEGG